MSPEKYFIDEYLKKISFLFKLTGMNLGREIKNNLKDILKYRSVYIINFLWLNTDVIGEIFWIIIGATSGKKFTELTYIAPCTTFCILANIKSLYLISNEDKLIELIEKLRNIEKADRQRRRGETDKSTNLERDKIINSERKFLTVVITALNFWNAITVILFALSPLMLMGIKYNNTKEVELMLPFLIVYPFDPFNIKYWPFVYLHQNWSAFVVVMEICGSDCLSYTCCTFIHMQFQLLQHDFEGIITSHDPDDNFNDEEFHQRLRDLVIRHEELIQSVELLESVYTKSTLYNFISSSLVICLTGFNVMAIDNLVFALPFISFLPLSLLQTYLLCFFGDMIMTSSLEISHAVYKSKWYLTDSEKAKHLLLVQSRAQKACKLTASGYADVNLTAFMRIVGKAWSFFTLLKTLYSSPRSQ